jgi:hypothetical protein
MYDYRNYITLCRARLASTSPHAAPCNIHANSIQANALVSGGITVDKSEVTLSGVQVVITRARKFRHYKSSK